MKRVILGLVAVVALASIPAIAQAGHPHHHHSHYRDGRNQWYSGYRGGWNRVDRYRRPPVVVYRPPVRVVRPIYPTQGATFYYNGPNASFGFGF